ncbi:MAG: hypothetical protein KDE26_04230 [Bacteroidetes bacterium]|nr:hypothetical protein [Bacteroidota bacterium]
MKKFVKFCLILCFFGLGTSLSFSQTTYIWNVEEEKQIDVKINDTIRFEGLETPEEFSILYPKKETINFNSTSSWILTEEVKNNFGPAFASGQIERISTRIRLTLIFPQKINLPDKPQNLSKKEKFLVGDAIFMANNLSRKNELRVVLEKYGIKDSLSLSKNGLLSKFIDKNIFNGNKIGDDQADEKDIDGLNLKNSFSNLGGLDVTKYADGLAKFLVKRSKEELTVSFFRQFEEAINSEGNEDFKTLFSNTASALLQMKDEIYLYQRYIQTLRESFERDMKTLPENIRKVINQNAHPELDANPELRTVLLSGIDIAIDIRDKTHPGEIIRSFNALDYQEYDPNVAAAFQTAQLISESLKEANPEDEKQYWVRKAYFRNEVLKNDTIFQIFLGLLAQKAKQDSIDFDTKTGKKVLFDQLMGIGSDYLKLRPYFDDVITNAQTIQSLIKEENSSDEKKSFEDVARYAESFNNLLQSSHVFLKALDIPYEYNTINKVLNIIDYSTNLYVNIAQKKYSAAALDLTLLYDISFPNNPQSKVIQRYVPFIAAMLQAENSDDVANVIEVFALPSGSSSVKRNTKANISINAYLGLYGGAEFDYDDEKDSWTQTPVFGITAPVGVAYSCGNLGKEKNTSFSVFASLIDIGAIASFRFQDDSTEVTKIYLKEIFSPGLFASIGFPNAPISLNAGVQSAPLLRSVNGNMNQISIKRNMRLSLSLVVDLPLLNIYTKP